MSQEKEQFTHAEYKAWQKVSQIMAKGSAEKEDPIDELDPSDPDYMYKKYQKDQKKLEDKRSRTLASLTPEKIKEVDSILDSMYINW
ncbi:hypothetical protein [Dyadobacter sp. LHD-138]|uniref:hypothetical protein n=1 Tax=Dyadobacter sp. LHD-138 TaxID=3071413 RepID=UPI0027E07390|nr:hypothetical protein [Dyadobacter sp. LHD-138]MDQ6482339.1 hypothetical protein [Dyadobacter sp. LHD-138]